MWASAQLRFTLFPFYVLLPGEIGLMGIADAGRVYVNGDSPGGFHGAVGGGVWVSFLEDAYALSVTLVNSEERTSIYIAAGFFF